MGVFLNENAAALGFRDTQQQEKCSSTVLLRCRIATFQFFQG